MDQYHAFQPPADLFTADTKTVASGSPLLNYLAYGFEPAEESLDYFFNHWGQITLAGSSPLLEVLLQRVCRNHLMETNPEVQVCIASGRYVGWDGS